MRYQVPKYTGQSLCQGKTILLMIFGMSPWVCSLILGFGCGFMEEDIETEGKGRTLTLETLEAESGIVSGSNNVIQGPAAPHGWALFQNKGSVCWNDVDISEVTAFEVHYGQPEVVTETFRLKFGSKVQDTVDLTQAGDWQDFAGRVKGSASGSKTNVTVCLEAITDNQEWVASIDKVVLTSSSTSTNFQTGSTSLTHDWKTITFPQPYSTPPIVHANMVSYRGGDPSMVRIRNVTATTFQIQVDEWDYRDGSHTTETVHWMAIEPGVHTINGTTLEAGKVLVTESWLTVSHSIGETPAVLATVATTNESSAVTPRIRNRDSNSFQVHLREEEVADNVHDAEDVHYIAFASRPTNNGVFSGGYSPDSVTHVRWYTQAFGSTFEDIRFFGHFCTADGGDTATMRANLSNSSVDVFVEEETSRDTELAHTTEVLCWMAVEQGSFVPGNDDDTSSCEGTIGFTTVDSDLCVNGVEYTVKGVNYDPQYEETCSTIPFYESTAFDDLWAMNDAASIAGMNANTIRTYTALSKTITSDDCKDDGRCWITNEHLDSLHAQGLKVILGISSHWDLEERQHIDMVSRYMSHPAVLAIIMGNEMNFNSLYRWDNSSSWSLVSQVNIYIDEARAAGWTKPIILGWGHPKSSDRDPLRTTTADMVAYQMYEGLDFVTENGETVFDWHRSTFDGTNSSERPGIITEYGADAINGGEGWGREDEYEQAYANVYLTTLIMNDALTEPAGFVGGSIFTWSDNWGKDIQASGGGNPCEHEIGGVTVMQGSGPHPDSTFHEKWWGQVRRDRSKRQAYWDIMTVYESY